MIVFVNRNPCERGSRRRSSNTIFLERECEEDAVRAERALRGRAVAVLEQIEGGKAELATMRGYDRIGWKDILEDVEGFSSRAMIL